MFRLRVNPVRSAPSKSFIVLESTIDVEHSQAYIYLLEITPHDLRQLADELQSALDQHPTQTES